MTETLKTMLMSRMTLNYQTKRSHTFHISAPTAHTFQIGEQTTEYYADVWNDVELSNTNWSLIFSIRITLTYQRRE